MFFISTLFNNVVVGLVKGLSSDGVVFVGTDHVMPTSFVEEPFLDFG